MHELGHTAGLKDLTYIMPDVAGDYIMGYLDATAIPTTDINYMKQVYRNEHGSEPH